MTDAVFAIISSDPHITRTKLSSITGINTSAIQKHIAKLKAEGRIKRVGGDRGGYWLVDKVKENQS